MSRPRSYHVRLSSDERKVIQHLAKKTSPSNISRRYSIILNADENRYPGNTYGGIASLLQVSVPTVINTLKLYVEGGYDIMALKTKRNVNSDTANLKVTADIEARIIAKACSQAPNGHPRWTLKLLHEAMTIVLEDSISRSTIGRVLSKNELRPHQSVYWCIPPEEDAEFVAHMEDILDLYQQPYNPQRPLWCIDEKPYQLLDESRKPIPMRRGQPTAFDSEYKRNGTVSIFVMIQPHTGRIEHSVEPTRTAIDWAHKIKYLVNEVEPNAEKIVLVQDNLNTHSIASLYKAFPPEEARRIASKLEIHYTPKHGSWLDIAEIGINIMTRECLERRIPSIEKLREECEAWSKDYNSCPTAIKWQYTTKDSRVKLKRLYPDLETYNQKREERVKEKMLSTEKSSE